MSYCLVVTLYFLSLSFSPPFYLILLFVVARFLHCGFLDCGLWLIVLLFAFCSFNCLPHSVCILVLTIFTYLHHYVILSQLCKKKTKKKPSPNWSNTAFEAKCSRLEILPMSLKADELRGSCPQTQHWTWGMSWTWCEQEQDQQSPQAQWKLENIVSDCCRKMFLIYTPRNTQVLLLMLFSLGGDERCT